MLVIVIDIPGILAAKRFFFFCSSKNELSIYDMTSSNIYHFPLPIYSQQTLDVAAVYEDAGQF